MFGGPGGHIHHGRGMFIGGPGHHHPGGFFGPGHHGHGGGYGVSPAHGPGGLVGAGPVFAPWLGALAVGAVAASVVSPYTSYDGGRNGMVVWREGQQEMSAPVNMVTVRVCQAQNLKKVQMIGKQDPYVRAKLLFNGHKIGECRSSTHTDGGRNPTWQNMARSVFTFYVPATVTLETLAVVLDVVNDNLVADSIIGTTGSIGLKTAATGESKWWNVSSGGTLQAIIELITPESGGGGGTGTHPNTAYSRSSAAAAAPAAASSRPSGGSYGGGRVATVNPSPHVAVAHATPVAAGAPGNAYGGATPVATAMSDPPPSYEQSHVAVASSYRPPPVAPGAAPAPAVPHGGAAYEKSNQYGYGGGGGDYNNGGYNNRGNAPAPAPAGPLPEAKAVPYVGGVAGGDPFNARGAAAAAATGGGARPSPYSAGAYGGAAAAAAGGKE
ncbi:unnamed protein product [Ectocarpus sp. 6 AP-2014]